MHVRPGTCGKKKVVFETERDSRESQLGVKTCLFSRKRVLFKFYYGLLGSFFQTPLFHKTCSQKILFRGKIGYETGPNSCTGVFSSEKQISIRVCFEKPLVTHVYNTSIQVLLISSSVF